MPLFECSACGVVENTATAEDGYYGRVPKGLPPICSQCATGHWHGRFERFLPASEGYVRRPNSWLLEAPDDRP